MAPMDSGRWTSVVVCVVALTSLLVESSEYSYVSNRDSLSIAAFNIQTFGPKKMAVPSVARVLVKASDVTHSICWDKIVSSEGRVLPDVSVQVGVQSLSQSCGILEGVTYNIAEPLGWFFFPRFSIRIPIYSFSILPRFSSANSSSCRWRCL